MTEGWISKKAGRYVFRFYTTRTSDGARVENNKVIGKISVLKTERAAMTEATRLGYLNLIATPTEAQLSFEILANHFIKNELEKTEGQIGRKAAETAARDKINLEKHCIPRWGKTLARDIKSLALERWYESLAENLSWPTVSKIRSAMSQAFNHGYRNELLTGSKENNPVRLSRCRTVSDYEAITVTPEQMVGILGHLDTPTTRLEWTIALTCAATGMRGEEVFGLRWQDINFKDGRIEICRGWSKGVETAGKNDSSMTPVAMHPVLASYLKEWRLQTLYAKDTDWVFASIEAKGTIPRAASTMAKKYLRPAAVSAGVLAEGDTSTRFGWHSLRHSLATYFGSLNVPVTVVQQVLRHASTKMTARYIHSIPTQQEALQGTFLKALRLNAGANAGVN